MWRRRDPDRELDDEIRTHLSMAERDLRDRGRPQNEARHEARRDFGNVLHVQEAVRSGRSMAWMRGLHYDLRYGARGLRRTPGVTLLIVIVLGLAIGFGTSLFTAFNTFFLAEWPVRDPSRLAQFRVNEDVASVMALADRSTAFTGMAAVTCQSCFARVDGHDVRFNVVTANFFEVVGVPMARGRGLAEDDGGILTAVVSYRFWQSVLAGDAEVVGRWIKANDVAVQVAGVAARTFTGTTLDDPPALWLPIEAIERLNASTPAFAVIQVVGRLADGVDRRTAQAEVDVLRSAASVDPARARKRVELRAVTYVPLSKLNEAGMLGLMAFGVLLVLLQACANVGNLLLARAAARVGETSVRIALGASRLRLIRQSLAESAVLAALAVGFGVVMSFGFPGLVLRAIEASVARPLDLVPFTPDLTVIAFACSLGVVSILAFGLAPALLSSRQNPVSGIKGQSGGTSARLGPRRTLLAVQVAVSTVLLLAAGAIVRSLAATAAIDPGFDLGDVAEARFETPRSAAEARRTTAATEFFTQAQLLDSNAVAVWSQPFGYASGAEVSLPGAAELSPLSVPRFSVTPNFFRVMGIPVIAGRSFDAEIPDGIVVSQTLASRIVESGSPIGRIVIVGDVAKQIVGVAADADLLGAFIRGDFSRTRPAVYEPLAAPSGAARVLVRRSRPDQIEALSARARLADPEGIIDVRPLTAARDARLGDARVAAGLAGMVGLAALTIAAVGLVGVFGYVARQRQRDIGIHLALGAPQSAVFRRVFGSSLRALAIGVCAGLAGGALAMPLLKGYVNPRVSAFDPATLAAVGLVLAAVAILAMFVPARAAMRVNPVTALRSD